MRKEIIDIWPLSKSCVSLLYLTWGVLQNPPCATELLGAAILKLWLLLWTSFPEKERSGLDYGSMTMTPYLVDVVIIICFSPRTSHFNLPVSGTGGKCSCLLLYYTVMWYRVWKMFVCSWPRSKLVLFTLYLASITTSWCRESVYNTFISTIQVSGDVQNNIINPQGQLQGNYATTLWVCVGVKERILYLEEIKKSEESMLI